MITIPMRDTPKATAETLPLAPHGTHTDAYPSGPVLNRRARSARLAALRDGAIRPGLAPGSDRIPPPLARILWAWAWGISDPRVTEVAIFLVARYQYCYWNRRIFRIPSVRELRRAICE